MTQIMALVGKEVQKWWNRKGKSASTGNGLSLPMKQAASTANTEAFTSMAESIEAISRIIFRCTRIEALLLKTPSNLVSQLADAILRLYETSLRFLAQASAHYSKNTGKRFLKVVSAGRKAFVEEPMLRVIKQEEEVLKLANLVNAEVNSLRFDGIDAGIRQVFDDNQRHVIEKQRQTLRKWINGISTTNTYETALQNHHDGTCEWVLKVPEFQKWKSNDPPRFESQITLAPWPTGIRKNVYIGLDHSTPGTPAVNTLKGCLFVVDGFDECGDIDAGAGYHHNEPKNLFLRDLMKYFAETASRVLVVSRDAPDIRECISEDDPAGLSAEGSRLERLVYGITAKDTTCDIQSFSTSMVERRLASKNSELRHQITSQAVERSQGMFLWIKLPEREITVGKNAKQLKEAVSHMPSGISNAYSRELERVINLESSEKEQAVMIFRWVLHASHPLTVKELVEAVVVSGQDLTSYPHDELPDCWNECFVDSAYVDEMILNSCGSLIELRSSSENQNLADKTVHFVHFSLKEYLIAIYTKPQLHDLANRLGLGPQHVEGERIDRICEGYIELYSRAGLDETANPFWWYAMASHSISLDDASALVSLQSLHS
ncbi:hypothetical protein QBC38DRAFT_547610 [Podospora fimiseda]|uniref:NACHT domain-containing protein n=1 Tax=Podospora fimiseda TaxID=252190 RepID=A0AAN7BJR8_9PEZI|nr:hypothetical protein QBC38DRAFT_547610 [Podospora fimiseda]